MFSGKLETLHETFEVSGSRCHARDAVTTQRWQWGNIENFHRSTENVHRNTENFHRNTENFHRNFHREPNDGKHRKFSKGQVPEIFFTSPSMPYFAGRQSMPDIVACQRHSRGTTISCCRPGGGVGPGPLAGPACSVWRRTCGALRARGLAGEASGAGVAATGV